MADKKAYWQRVLQQLDFVPQAGAKALDAGCGPAGIFITLHEQSTITALDPLLEKYEQDLSIFSQSDYPSVHFVPTALEAVNTTEQFAEIYCFNAINHVADWELALDQLTRMAHPGTRMILSSDVHRHKWLLPIFRWLPGDMLHPQQHGPEAYQKALLKRGWQIQQEQIFKQDLIFDYTVWICTLR